jgi:trans-o-hydroxybenzylidenepyruvate hydratase-aldolase
VLTAKDIKGWVGIVETPAKPGADDWRLENTVDLDETARIAELMIKDGASCYLAQGTGGECPTLLWEEQKAYAGVLLETVKKRIPVFVGTTTLSTRDTIRRLRAMMDMGANGTLLGIPMWQAPTMEVALAHYKMVAEAVPSANIFVYANQQAFRFAFAPGFWGAIHRQVPAVIAAKYQDVAGLLPSLEASENAINFVPVYNTFYTFALLSPETTTATWTHSMQPSPVLALLDAVKKRDMVRAKQIQNDIRKTSVGPPIPRDVFGQYNIQLVRDHDEAAGYIKRGPARPPYHVMPEKMVEEAKEHGRKWKELAEKYNAILSATR